MAWNVYDYPGSPREEGHDPDPICDYGPCDREVPDDERGICQHPGCTCKMLCPAHTYTCQICEFDFCKEHIAVNKQIGQWAWYVCADCKKAQKEVA
jgi:hypothetical protein